MRLIILVALVSGGYVAGLHLDAVNIAIDYFLHKEVKFVCYLSCEKQNYNNLLVKALLDENIRVSLSEIDRDTDVDLDKLLYQWTASIGVLLDGSCETNNILDKASRAKLFDAMYIWLILTNEDESNDTFNYIDDSFQHLNISIDADIAVVSSNGNSYSLTDVYNFGKIQGNNLEKAKFGIWRRDIGIPFMNTDEYLARRHLDHVLYNFSPDVFYPQLLSEVKYTAGIAAMTKITSQLLNLLKEKHNFRFNYTVAERWIGSPERNSTLETLSKIGFLQKKRSGNLVGDRWTVNSKVWAEIQTMTLRRHLPVLNQLSLALAAVTNALFWEEQDLSSTCARIFPQWLDWVDIYFPPTTHLETKFYYLVPDKGVGDYENRFLTPMSLGVWWCILVAGVVCTFVLAAAAWLENRPQTSQYAFFSVYAAICQQDYEDGIPISDQSFSSQGRRLTLLVIGLLSMLLYNYYTSSVVSWLLNAVAPSIANIDGLISSDLELIFEDIGYTRGWLDNPGFFYYSGFKNPKEDELRDKKVTSAKRMVPPLQPVTIGIELMRTGAYAYHTEPYTASQVISKTFQEQELCELGALQMMLPAHVYIMSQKRSPYKQFFVWSLMRLLERGHVQASRGRFAGTMPACSGRWPRALALGQAAPAFLLLLQFVILSFLILVMELTYRRFQQKHRRH